MAAPATFSLTGLSALATNAALGVVNALPPSVSKVVLAHPFVFGAGAAFFALFLVAQVWQRLDSASAFRAGSAPALPGVFNDIDDSKHKSDRYTELFNERGVEDRKSHAQELVNHYYDLVTSFYEYGWGDSFHFAPRYAGETFRESIARHEYALGSRLGFTPGQKVVDVGCGVGGPARQVARFTGATVVGLNNNDFQVKRATVKAVNDGMAHLVSFRKGDFMKMPFEDASFDGAFSIEATCHAPDRVGVFAEVLRVLKPGAVFGSYEWVMTDNYDPTNKEHNDIKRGIELGDSLPDLITRKACLQAFEDAGFEIVEAYDLSEKKYSPVPWYEPFVANWNLENFKSRPLGLILSHTMVTIMEFLRIAPAGSTQIHSHLWTATETLLAGGQQAIFTPMYYVKVRKPLAGASAKRAGATPSRGRSVGK